MIVDKLHEYRRMSNNYRNCQSPRSYEVKRHEGQHRNRSSSTYMIQKQTCITLFGCNKSSATCQYSACALTSLHIALANLCAEHRTNTAIVLWVMIMMNELLHCRRRTKHLPDCGHDTFYLGAITLPPINDNMQMYLKASWPSYFDEVQGNSVQEIDCQ